MKTLIHSRRGQTLVEALVALSILTVGFIGIISLLTKSFQLNRTTTDNTQGTYLAEEGIEIAKNLIDHDIYAGLTNNNDFFGQCFGVGASPGYFKVEYDSTTCTTLPSGQSAQYGGPLTYLSDPLYFNPTTHFYTYNTFAAIKSSFTRKITVSMPSAYEIDVKSTVNWNDNGVANSVTLEDHFYDWHPL